MPFQKGHKKIGGRKVGSKNKTGADVKAAIVEAFYQAGGVDYLASIAKTHPSVFGQLVSKVVPAELKVENTGKDGGPIIHEVVIEHHGIPATVNAADGGSGERSSDAAISSGADAGVAVNGAVPSDLGGDAIGEDIVVPVVVAPRDQGAWIR